MFVDCITETDKPGAYLAEALADDSPDNSECDKAEDGGHDCDDEECDDDATEGDRHDGTASSTGIY